jgi:hypothetical protein
MIIRNNETATSNLRAKKFRRMQATCAAKTHRVYSFDDVCRLYGVSRNTPANWIKQGLLPIDDRRDKAFASAE